MIFHGFLHSVCLPHALALADRDLFSSARLDLKHVQSRNLSLSDGIPCTRGTDLSAQIPHCFPLTFPCWYQALKETPNASKSLRALRAGEVLQSSARKRKAPSGRFNLCRSVLPQCISAECLVLYCITILLLETTSNGKCKVIYFGGGKLSEV